MIILLTLLLIRASFVLSMKNGDYLASASDDNTIKIWETKTWNEIPNKIEHQDAVYSVAFSPIKKVNKAKKERLKFLEEKLGKGKTEELFYFETTQTGDVKAGHLKK